MMKKKSTPEKSTPETQAIDTTGSNVSDQAIPGNDPTPPTQASREKPWLYVYDYDVEHDFFNEDGGKWLVILSERSIDLYWSRIREAVIAGKLGGRAKV